MHAMRAWPLRTAIVVAGTFCVSGCGPIDAGPLAVANEGGHVVVLAPICRGRLTDILVDVERGDAEHPQVWHHGAISHDLSVDLMAPADGWTGPTLVLSPGTTYTVSGGADFALIEHARRFGTRTGSVQFTLAQVQQLAEDEVIVSNVSSMRSPASKSPADESMWSIQVKRADFFASAC